VSKVILRASLHCAFSDLVVHQSGVFPPNVLSQAGHQRLGNSSLRPELVFHALGDVAFTLGPYTFPPGFTHSDLHRMFFPPLTALEALMCVPFGAVHFGFFPLALVVVGRDDPTPPLVGPLKSILLGPFPTVHRCFPGRSRFVNERRFGGTLLFF